MNIHSKEAYKDREVKNMMEVTKKEAVELLEKEKAYMIGHGGDRQAKALNSAIKALDKEDRIMQILDDCDLEAWDMLEKIKEVVRT